MERTATVHGNEERARKQLVRQCRELEVEAQRLRSEAVSHASITCKTPKEKDDPLLTLVRLREEQCLLGERLSCMQASPPEASTGDQTVLERRVVAGLHETVASLKSSIETLDDEHEQLCAALQRYHVHAEQLKELSGKVTSQYQMTSLTGREEVATSPSGDAVSMATLTKQMKHRYRLVESKVSDFLAEYYPEEEEQPSGSGAGDAAASPSFKKKRRKRGKYMSDSGGDAGGAAGAQEQLTRPADTFSLAVTRPADTFSLAVTRPADTFSLAVTIEQLLNIVDFGDQSQPYLTWTADHWAPYKELLVGAGIAEQHPEDCNQIKLVPVHGDLVASEETLAT